MRKLLPWFVGLMWAAVLLGGAFRPDPDLLALEPGPFVGRPAPLFETVDLEGRPVSLADYEGKAVLVNFWASWCGPCRLEMPELERLAANPPAGTAVIAVNMTAMDSETDMRQYLDRSGLDLPVWLDPEGKIADLYQVSSMPTTVVIDPTGRVAYRILGPMPHAAMVNFLTQARR